jgi:hypothetical protein
VPSTSAAHPDPRQVHPLAYPRWQLAARPG